MRGSGQDSAILSSYSGSIVYVYNGVQMGAGGGGGGGGRTIIGENNF